MNKKEGWQQFLSLCHKAETIEQLDELFSLLFTLEEKDTMSTRILLIKELLMGQRTQRDIAQYLNISIAKITRGSNAIKSISSDLKQFLME